MEWHNLQWVYTQPYAKNVGAIKKKEMDLLHCCPLGGEREMKIKIAVASYVPENMRKNEVLRLRNKAKTALNFATGEWGTKGPDARRVPIHQKELLFFQELLEKIPGVGEDVYSNSRKARLEAFCGFPLDRKLLKHTDSEIAAMADCRRAASAGWMKTGEWHELLQKMFPGYSRLVADFCQDQRIEDPIVHELYYPLPDKIEMFHSPAFQAFLDSKMNGCINLLTDVCINPDLGAPLVAAKLSADF